MTEILNEIYYWVGFVIIWASGIVVSGYILGKLGREFLELLGRHFKWPWQMVEYFKSRNEFKKWQKQNQSE